MSPCGESYDLSNMKDNPIDCAILAEINNEFNRSCSSSTFFLLVGSAHRIFPNVKLIPFVILYLELELMLIQRHQFLLPFVLQSQLSFSTTKTDK